MLFFGALCAIFFAPTPGVFGPAIAWLGQVPSLSHRWRIESILNAVGPVGRYARSNHPVRDQYLSIFSCIHGNLSGAGRQHGLYAKRLADHRCLAGSLVLAISLAVLGSCVSIRAVS